MTLERLTDYAHQHIGLKDGPLSRTAAICMYAGIIQSMTSTNSVGDFDAVRTLVTKHIRSFFLPIAEKTANADVMVAADAVYMGTAAYTNLVIYAGQKRQASLDAAGGVLTKEFKTASPAQIDYQHWDKQCKKMAGSSADIAQRLVKLADNSKLAYTIRYNALAKLKGLEEAAEMSGYKIDMEAHKSGLLAIFKNIGVDESEFIQPKKAPTLWDDFGPGLVK